MMKEQHSGNSDREVTIRWLNLWAAKRKADLKENRRAEAVLKDSLTMNMRWSITPLLQTIFHLQGLKKLSLIVLSGDQTALGELQSEACLEDIFF